MTTKVTKQFNKKFLWTVVKVECNGARFTFTVHENHGKPYVLLHGHASDMEIDVGRSDKLMITRTNDDGSIDSLKFSYP